MTIEALLPGHIVWIDATNKFYVIAASEGLKYVTNTGNATEFAALASGATSSNIAISTLEPDDNPPHLYQLVFGVGDGMQYKLQVPTGTTRLGPDQDRTSAYITVNDSVRYAPNEDLTETWLVKYYFPAFTVYNATPVSGTPQVWFYGKSYDIREITNANVLINLRNALTGAGPSNVPFKRISIGGVKRTAG